MRSEMVYLISEPPSQCPHCARPYVWHGDARTDFLNCCVQSCVCGTQFQYLPADLIQKASRLHPQGDLLLRP